MAQGVVKFYKREKGWGAISSPELPPGRDAWVHFSMIEGEGYRELVAGEPVEFDIEAVQQDSFDFRAPVATSTTPLPWWLATRSRSAAREKPTSVTPPTTT